MGEYIGAIVILIFFSFFLYLAYGAHESFENRVGQFELKCKDLGYERLTDYKIDKSVNSGHFFKVECDDEPVDRLFFCEDEFVCKKEDKWGDCSKHDFEVRC